MRGASIEKRPVVYFRIIERILKKVREASDYTYSSLYKNFDTRYQSFVETKYCKVI